jgi:NADH-quinone oxidoreductase subunit N
VTPYLTSETVHLLFPELLVGSLAVAICIAGAFVRSRSTFGCIALLGLATAVWLLVRQESRLAVLDGGAAVTSGPLVIDALAQLTRFGVLALGALLVIAAWRAGPDDLATDYLGSLLLSLCGLMLVATANELVLLFVAFELISIPTYILLFLGRSDAQSQEAATKYFLLSVLSSAVLLYGLALLYGTAGSTQLAEVRALLASSDSSSVELMNLMPAALVLILAGLSFKMAAVPFQFYAPDVYQGTTAANAGLLAVLPKVAGMLALVRIFVGVAPSAGASVVGWQLLLSVAVVTMTVGNVLALWQNNIRRMMAYSSIAHAGYMLVGLAVALAASDAQAGVPFRQGVAAALFYLGVYSFATLGTFAALVSLSTADRELNDVSELSGLAQWQPVIAAALAVFMFSLIGIPPLAGFWGKFRLVSGALSLDEAVVSSSIAQWFRALAIITVLNAAVSAGYYLRIVAAMYFGTAEKPIALARRDGARFAAVVATAMVVYLGIAPGGFWTGTDTAASSIVQQEEQATGADASLGNEVRRQAESAGASEIRDSAPTASTVAR